MIFFKFQYGFRKGFNVVNCLFFMTEKRTETIDQGGTFGALLTDFSKAFKCLLYNLMIT